MRIGKAFSAFGLADRFRQEVALLVKDEVRLAKVEMSEKMAVLKRNAIGLGIGAFVAFAGLVLLSLAVGRLLALTFQGLGWSESLSNFVGIAAASLVILLVGLGFVLKGVKTLSQSSLKPERTLETLRDLRTGDGQTPAAQKMVEPKALQPSKEELAYRIDHTRSELKETMHKAGKRVAWTSVAAVLGRQVRRHPLRVLVLGAGAGLARQALRRRRAKHKVNC